MYAPYDVYNFCDLCQSACLGNEVEIVRKRTADLRKKVKLLEGDIINDADDCGPIFTIATGESSYNLKSPPKTVPPCNYQVYPVTVPGCHFSQCIHSGAASYSIAPEIFDLDDKDAIAKSGCSRDRSLENLKSQIKEKDVRVKTISCGTLLDQNSSNDNATKTSTECKEMMQLCTALINELREARTDLTTIVNKCLKDRSNIDNVSTSSSKADEKVVTGKAEHSREIERKKSSSKMSKCREKKKWGKIKKDEKLTVDDKIDPHATEDKKLARPEVLATLVDCLETMKSRSECTSVVEELIDRLENKIIIKRACDCSSDIRHNDVKSFKQNVENSPSSSYQRTANCPLVQFREDNSTNENTVQEAADHHKNKISEKEFQTQKDHLKKLENDSGETKNVAERANISSTVKNSFMNETVEKSAENKKVFNYQESYGGCCCSGNRQPYCTCGSHPEPPCGTKALTVIKKCTQKTDKKGKQPKESKSTTRKRPCFHIWPENTRCLKRCPNRS
ncbi:uncharacterized protein LOC112493957 isoform X2 [Cephus cinctus]|uniref:Uncharacterized protein LOC112493957 isoform X2 n=1 Tax=Cephus cinctus TaxID=211228 RepID=A0AAJ7RBY4_CEPCN|nr:uncharacterized protein LOC112493957 isoform X2 [Cephus cinctus]